MIDQSKPEITECRTRKENVDKTQKLQQSLLSQICVTNLSLLDRLFES